ncbi:MAG: hypothetical protein JNJ47_02270, partial [Alphaproteobacteria bacterium]|nr:hypothetical protein [Alphaproteobacteria bacterium]
YAPKIFIPVILVLIIAFLILLFVGLRRQCKISPMDELNQFSAKLVGVDRSYEIKAPNSLLTKELFSALVIPTYPENEPPVGVIEGDVTDKNAIKILTDDQRKALAEKEEIIQHQKDVVVKVEALTIKSELPQTAVSIPPEQDSKPTAHQ